MGGTEDLPSALVLTTIMILEDESRGLFCRDAELGCSILSDIVQYVGDNFDAIMQAQPHR